jgi:23S rRNA (uridine2479-2'-O)-methyltransferase
MPRVMRPSQRAGLGAATSERRDSEGGKSDPAAVRSPSPPFRLGRAHDPEAQPIGYCRADHEQARAHRQARAKDPIFHGAEREPRPGLAADLAQPDEESPNLRGTTQRMLDNEPEQFAESKTMAARTLRVMKRNSAFQVLASLRANRQKRQATRTFVLEGVQPIDTALACGWQFEAILFEGGARLSRWASAAISRSSASVLYEMSPELLEELSGKDTPSELLAVVRMPEDDLGRIPVRPDLAVAVVDRPSSPGNLGSLIRSCDAFGAHGVIVTGHAVDVYDPATITASRGSLFAVPVVRLGSLSPLRTWIDDVGQLVGPTHVIGADEKGAVEISNHDFRGPTVAVFGNEAHGLSRACREMCDRMVTIPMTGSATSLNLSVAASIVFYEIRRQRAARR